MNTSTIITIAGYALLVAWVIAWAWGYRRFVKGRTTQDWKVILYAAIYLLIFAAATVGIKYLWELL